MFDSSIALWQYNIQTGPIPMILKTITICLIHIYLILNIWLTNSRVPIIKPTIRLATKPTILLCMHFSIMFWCKDKMCFEYLTQKTICWCSALIMYSNLFLPLFLSYFSLIIRCIVTYDALHRILYLLENCKGTGWRLCNR